jgi:hypothetical protein
MVQDKTGASTRRSAIQRALRDFEALSELGEGYREAHKDVTRDNHNLQVYPVYGELDSMSCYAFNAMSTYMYIQPHAAQRYHAQCLVLSRTQQPIDIMH